MSDRLTDGSDMTAVQGPETRKRFPGLFNPTVDREAGLPLHLRWTGKPGFRSICCHAVNHVV